MNSIKVYKWNTSVTFTVALPPGPPTTLAAFSGSKVFASTGKDCVCVVFAHQSGPKSSFLEPLQNKSLHPCLGN